MNDFERQIAGIKGEGLYSVNIETLQVNLGLLCNQQCAHCHLEASPGRNEIMEWPVMGLVLEAAKRARCQLVDLTAEPPSSTRISGVSYRLFAKKDFQSRFERI